MQFNRKNITNLALIASVACFATLDVVAQSTGRSVGDVATNVSKSLDGSVTLVNSAAYLVGAICVFMGVLLFKKNREDPRSEPLGKAIGVMLAGVFFLFLPEMINTGQQTVWGGSATKVQQGKSTL